MANSTEPRTEETIGPVRKMLPRESWMSQDVEIRAASSGSPLLAAWKRAGGSADDFARIAPETLDDYEEAKLAQGDVNLATSRPFWEHAKALVSAREFAAFVGEFAEGMVFTANAGPAYVGTRIKNPTGACIRRFLARLGRGEFLLAQPRHAAAASPLLSEKEPNHTLTPIFSARQDARTMARMAVAKRITAKSSFDDFVTTESLCFHSSRLVRVSLPHRDPGDVPHWSRRNRDDVLVIVPGRTATPDGIKSSGYPYGVIPRLLLIYIVTEVKRTGSPRVHLGDSVFACLKALGLSNGAENYRAARTQLTSLFTASISSQKSSAREGSDDATRLSALDWVACPIASEVHLWWRSRASGEDLLGGWVELAEKFFDEIRDSAFPVDLHAVRALRRSTLALDFYVWAATRMYWMNECARKEFEVSWVELHEQFGASFARISAFRAKFSAAIANVESFWRGRLNYEIAPDGLILRPSPLPVPSEKAKRR